VVLLRDVGGWEIEGIRRKAGLELARRRMVGI